MPTDWQIVHINMHELFYWFPSTVHSRFDSIREKRSQHGFPFWLIFSTGPCQDSWCNASMTLWFPIKILFFFKLTKIVKQITKRYWNLHYLIIVESVSKSIWRFDLTHMASQARLRSGFRWNTATLAMEVYFL